MNKPTGKQMVRIIGGEWRSRKVPFPAIDGLRPTQDRLRETLFNWLMFELAGKRCLDAFAGSGALGLEALSRRAGEVVFLEHDALAASSIKAFLLSVKCEQGKVVNTETLRYLSTPSPSPFDVVFLDPPFRKDLLRDTCHRLEHLGHLAENAWIYVECEADLDPGIIPDRWAVHREIRTPTARLTLYRRQPA